MSETKAKTVYLFCCDPQKDPVASHVFLAAQHLFPLVDTNIAVDGHAVRRYDDTNGNTFFFVQTNEVVSYDYPHYLPMLNQHFADCDFAGLVNWHEGANAPDDIFCVHTTGDVPSGCFGPANPIYMRNLLLAIDENRKEAGLSEFTTTSEATHWSGVPFGGAPELIAEYPTPLVDIEIGSSPPNWSNMEAAGVLARSLVQVFDRKEEAVRSLLCVGGMHFDANFSAAVLNSSPDHPLAVSHILPNQWVVSGSYGETSALKKLEACAASIVGGIHAIAFHDNLKGPYKAQLRTIGERLNIPVFKHQALRQPETLPLW